MNSSAMPRPESQTDPMAQTDPAEYLAEAVRIAVENVRNEGGPFGAVVVTADGQVFEGVNRVTADLDPSAHATPMRITRKSARTRLGQVTWLRCLLRVR